MSNVSMNIHKVTSIEQKTYKNSDYIVTTIKIRVSSGDDFVVTAFHKMGD